MKIILTTIITDKSWKRYPEIQKKNIKPIISYIITKFPNLQPIKKLELSMMFTDNQTMHKLNQQFLDKNKPTNVLSFPDIELGSTKLINFKPDLDHTYLGDIAFGYQIIALESEEQNKQFAHHLTHLIVHAVLHLLGYDHEEEEEAKVMEKMEIEILEHFGIPCPY